MSLHYRQSRHARVLGVKGVIMSEKSESNSPKPDVPNVEELIIEVRRLMPGAVKSACRSYHPHPSPEEMEDIGEDILLLLINDHYHYLLTFENRASLKTWLYQIVRRYVNRRLQKPKMIVSLDDVPDDSLSYAPTQEEEVWFEEMRRTLKERRSKLTARQRQLLELREHGLSQAEIAQELRLDPKVVYRRRYALFKKLRRLLEGS